MQLDRVEADALRAQRGGDEIARPACGFPATSARAAHASPRRRESARRDGLPRRLARGRAACRPSRARAPRPCGRRGASWMPIGFFDRRRQAWITRAIAASLSSLYRPVQPCVMRPSRVTPVASTTIRPGAGVGEVAEMHQVPVGHAAVVGRVLAHRRDDDAVRQRDAAELEGREELRVRQVRFLRRRMLF